MWGRVVWASILCAGLVGSAHGEDDLRSARKHARSKDTATKLRGVRELIKIDSMESIRELERVIKDSATSLDRVERELTKTLAAQLRLLPIMRRLIRKAEAGANIEKDADRVLARNDALKRQIDKLQRDMRVHLTIVKTAGEGFIQFRDPGAIESIEQGVKTEFNTMMRVFYIAGMRDASRRSSVPVLIETLGDSDPRIRAAVVRALVPLAREPGVQAAVEPLFADENWTVRLGAYQVMAGAPFAQAVERLCKAARDEKGEVAFAVDAYLEQLTGLSYSQDPSQWATWWKKNEVDIKRGEWVPKPREEKDTGETKSVASFFRIPLTSRRILFAIDFSDSMSIPHDVTDPNIARLIKKYKLQPTRLGYAKAEFIRALGGLPDGARFGVVGYNDDVKSFRSGKMVELKPATRKAAIRWIVNLKTADLTNIFSAVNAVFKDYMASGGAQRLKELPDTVMLLTDGNATRGRFTEARDILDMAEIWNGPLEVVFHCVGIGKHHDKVLLSELAKSTGGYYVDGSKSMKALKPRHRRIPDDIPFERAKVPTATTSDDADAMDDDDDPELRSLPPAVRKLVMQFEDGDANEMVAAANELGAMGARAAPAAPVLVEGLSDYRDEVLDAVRGALEKIGAAAVPALIRGIEDGDPDVIIGAAQTIAAMGPKGRAAARALAKYKDDEDEQVRSAVRKALVAIRG